MGKRTSATSPGRPPKFAEPCSLVTVTLPDRILRSLREVDEDRAKAIVRCVEAALATSQDGESKVAITRVDDEVNVILLGQSPSLRSIPWVRLIEVAPSRFLLAIKAGMSIEAFELTLIDLLDNHPPEDPGEREMLAELRRQLATHRREQLLQAYEIVVLGN